MAQIELPPNMSTQGIALMRELSELVVRYFRDEKASGYVQPDLAPLSNITPIKQDGDGPFGDCPRCGDGKVMRQHRKDGGSHLACTAGSYDFKTKTKTGCQWKAWDEEQQDAFFSGRPIKWPTSKKNNSSTFVKRTNGSSNNRATSISDNKSISKSPATVPNQDVAEAASIIDSLNDLSQAQRNQVLKPLGYNPTGSYVQFVFAQDSAKLEVIASAIMKIVG